MAVGYSLLCHSRGTPTMSTPIQASHKSVQPFAIANVATMGPTKIQASHQKYHRSTGNPAPITEKSHWQTTTPAAHPPTQARRPPAVAQRGGIAGADSARWDLL